MAKVKYLTDEMIKTFYPIKEDVIQRDRGLVLKTIKSTGRNSSARSTSIIGRGLRFR